MVPNRKAVGTLVDEAAHAFPVLTLGALVPKAGDCENLLVPWALSATHIAFGSIRMEPVFMILSQSASIAADLCLQDNLAVQNLSYEKLRPQLLKAGQSLDPK